MKLNEKKTNKIFSLYKEKFLNVIKSSNQK